MGLLSKMGGLLSEAFRGPEHKINDLSQSVVKAYRPGVSTEQALETLKQAAERRFTPEVQVRVFKKALRDAGLAAEGREEADLYVVAIGNVILNWIGEDTMVHGAGGDRERMRKLCEAQQARINFASLDREALQETLRRSFEIKSAWKGSGHPGFKICRITDPEAEAKEAWDRTHPPPGP
jgi:hypothetical protein